MTRLERAVNAIGKEGWHLWLGWEGSHKRWSTSAVVSWELPHDFSAHGELSTSPAEAVESLLAAIRVHPATPLLADLLDALERNANARQTAP